jgi:hypothetical protein
MKLLKKIGKLTSVMALSIVIACSSVSPMLSKETAV